MTTIEMDKLRTFPNLSAAAFQHPLDVQAVAGISQVPLLATFLTKISGSLWERQMWLSQISSTLRLGPNQGQSLYKKFVQAATILDIPELPEIYVSNQYTINAYAFGIERYQITLYSGLIDSLSEAELMAVIGHELGHVKCQHMLYKTMAFIIRLLGMNSLNNFLPAGTGLLASLSLQLAILQWERMAELSCDRASLLVVQDPKIVASALTKLAGGSRGLADEITLEGVLQQAQEYHDAGDNLLEKILKVNMMLFQTHPFPVVRVKEITEWAESAQYQQIMQGDYAQTGVTQSTAMNEPTGLVCPNCEEVNPSSRATCLACGETLSKSRLVCTQCGLKVFDTWQRCPGCGSELRH